MTEAVIFMGLQATGKSTFYLRRFFDSHQRINLDTLGTRQRERLLFETCLVAKLRIVIDNTNPAVVDRARYIVPARAAGFRATGYYFESNLEACKARNLQRPEHRVVPLPGLLDTLGKLQRPNPSEGFDKLHYVRIADDGDFVVEDWIDEV